MEGLLLVLNYINNNIYCLKLNAIFQMVKMNFGSKFGAWVPFLTAILLSGKFQENLRQTLVVLPLAYVHVRL